MVSRGFVMVATAVAVAMPFALMSLPASSAPVAAGPVTGAATGTDPYLAPQGNGGYDVIDYDLDLSYAAASHGIAAASVVITARASQTLRHFSLDARSGLRIKSVTVDGRAVDHDHRKDKLVVRGVRTIGAGKIFRVRVDYAGDPIAIRDTSGRGDYGWIDTPKGSVTYTEPTGTSTWLPSNDVFYDKATWRVRLSAPKPLLGVSTGRFLGKKVRDGRTVTTWRQATPIQPYTQVVAFDHFDTSTRSIAGLPAFTAVAKRSGVSVDIMHSRTERAIRWMVDRLGKYPFESAGAIVVRGGDSAMETAGRPTYSSGAWNTSMETVVHEQAHQWFGNLLTATSAQDIWLHEGFATYLENVETAERTGRPLADIVHEQYVWDGWGAKWRGQFGRVSLHEPTMRYLLNTTPYYRGQAALHALRQQVGDATFWHILRVLADEPAGRTSSTAKVIAEAEAASGLDLSAWADAWVYSVAQQPLPEAPSHESVVAQIGPYLLDAASDFVWDPRGRPLPQMRRATKNWQPLNQLRVTDVTTVRVRGNVRYLVDFQTSQGVVYPGSYRSCFVFEKKDTDVLAGSLIGVKYSDDFAVNRFTLQPCKLPAGAAAKQ